jgi:putative ATPase
VYWLARMLVGGESLEFIGRRLLILASEDIGLANPNALLMAQTCFEAIRVIGNPESRIILSQTVIYLASSPKSNSAYMAINKAMDYVQKTGNLPVPLHLRNAPTRLMKDLNYGADYKYPHDFPGNFVDQNYFPEVDKKPMFYQPGKNANEDKLSKINRDIPS